MTRIFTLTAGLLVLLAAAVPARASVMVLAKETLDEEKNKSKRGGTQTVTIDITINGKAKDPETRIIKWTAFGKDQNTGELVSMESGEIPVNLAGSTQKTSTKKMTTTYTEKHNVAEKKTGGGRDNRNVQIKYKEVPGTGVKYYGYGIEVLDGGTVVGSKFDPRTLEKKK